MCNSTSYSEDIDKFRITPYKMEENEAARFAYYVKPLTFSNLTE